MSKGVVILRKFLIYLLLSSLWMLPNSWTQQDKQLLLSDVLVYLPAQHSTRRLSEVQSAESSVRQLPRDSCHEDPIKIKRKILCWHAPNTVKNATMKIFKQKITPAHFNHFSSPKHNFSSMHIKHRQTWPIHLINDLPLCSVRPSTWLQCFPAKNDLVPQSKPVYFKVYTLEN